MTVAEIKQFISNELNGLYHESEIRSFTRILIEDLANIPFHAQVIYPEDKIQDDDKADIVRAVRELKRNKPIQYIIGKTRFYGNDFHLTSKVLIPRPETEELVDLIVRQFAHVKNLSVLDIGTGSGCIAVSLAKALPDNKVFALDISEEALEVARKNAELNSVSVEFLQMDILNPNQIFSGNKFDIIVSNPPYVRELEKAMMQKNVLDFEPETALFVSDENPLVFYDAISKFALKNLKSGGYLFFEINEYLSKEMIELVEKHGFKDAAVMKDLSGKPRMLSCFL